MIRMEYKHAFIKVVRQIGHIVTAMDRKSLPCDSHIMLCMTCAKVRTLLSIQKIGKPPVRIITKNGIYWYWGKSGRWTVIKRRYCLPTLRKLERERLTPYQCVTNTQLGGCPLVDSANGYVADAVGEVVQVCVLGRCKLKVDGTDNIAIGDALVTHAAAGFAQKLAVDTTLPVLSVQQARNGNGRGIQPQCIPCSTTLQRRLQWHCTQRQQMATRFQSLFAVLLGR